MTTDVLLILGTIFVWAAAALLGLICFFTKKPHSSTPPSYGKLLPLGVANWEDIVDYNMFYVDKTSLLNSLITTKRKVFLARPQGMGKSLLCSMLADLLVNGTGDFKNTAIYDAWPDKNRYQVIKLSFGGLAGSDEIALRNSLKGLLVEAYLNAGFAQVKKLEFTATTLNRLLNHLSSISLKQRLVFLIDDWDYPLTANYDYPVRYQAVLAVLSEFYAWLNKLDHVRFILVTGQAHELSSKLVTCGDIRDISADPEYATVLGLTQDELELNYRPFIEAAAQRRGDSIEAVRAALEACVCVVSLENGAEVKLYNPRAVNRLLAP